MWSSEIPQLSAVTSSTCLDVCSSLLLAALPSTMELTSGTPLTGGIPGIPLQPLYNPDLFSALLPYVQIRAVLLYPAQLCYNIQQPFMAMNIPLVRYIANGQIKMHKMMQHR